MTFWDYWLRLNRANPSLANQDAKLTLSVESFKRQLEKAFEAGKISTGKAADLPGDGAFSKVLDDLFQFSKK